MKKNQKRLSFLATLPIVGALLSPGIAQGIAIIDSLDFSLTGSRVLDCDILGKIELERDPSWDNEEFYIHLVEQYAVDASDGEFASIEAYRGYVNEAIKNNWNTFNSIIYHDYASVYHRDYSSNFDYYNNYTDELKEDYYRAYIFDSLELGPYGFDTPSTYDVIANYCSAEHSPITTTYGNHGYSGYMKLGDREVIIDEEELLALNNGYAFHEDGFGDLKVELIRIDDTTIRAKYTLKNLTGENINYGVAFYSDIEFGDNDRAAISKTNRSFTVTQDNHSYDSTFAAQFNIQLDPVATTTYVGRYYDAKEHRWTNSEKDYYTTADEVDTGLAYSWQGQINADETKVFSATFTMGIAETFGNRFFHLADDYSEPEIVDAIDGGMLKMPRLGLSENIGYHREWNTKMDGTGSSYQSSDVIIANKDRFSYYEQDVPNEVVSAQGSNDLYEEYNIVISDEIKEAYRPIAENSFSNFFIGVDLWNMAREDIEILVDAGIIPEDLITDIVEKDNHVFDSAFIAEDFEKSYIDQDGNWQYENFEEDDFPVTVRIKLSDKRAKGKTDFRLVGMDINSLEPDYEGEDPFKEVPIRFDSNTGELFFEVYNDSTLYFLSYVEKPDIEVPSTGVNSRLGASAAVSVLTYAATGSVLALIALAIKRKINRL